MRNSNFTSTPRKTKTINVDTKHYGTFAEIGAGQEVARHFFMAGNASNTVAKTMSAYDKTFSDSIYGKGDRFVSQARLNKMLSHEYNLLEERLAEFASERAFFSFANTVATSSHEVDPTCHCWMGVRFQLEPRGPINDVQLHVRMLDRFRLQQQEALGILGVNLIFSSIFRNTNPTELVETLYENLGTDRVEVNYIHINGKDLSHLDNRLLSLELLTQGLSKSVMFTPEGDTISPVDCLYGKPIVVLRGTFRPVTNVNLQILKKGTEQLYNNIKNTTSKKPISLFEMTMNQLQTKSGDIQQKDFLDRVDTLCALGHHVLISNYPLFYQIKKYLRRITNAPIALLMGASLLEKLFDKKYYPGKESILSAFATIFDDGTQIYVFPYKTSETCMTAKTFHPEKSLQSLYNYFLENNCIVDISGCDDVDTTLHSENVRKMLNSGSNEWETLVPMEVAKLIKSKKLFGYKG